MVPIQFDALDIGGIAVTVWERDSIAPQSMARHTFALVLMLLWPSAGATAQTDGGNDSEPAMGRREAFADTTLIENGAADCLIVHPAGDEPLAMQARSLAAHLKALTGVEIGIKTDTEIVARRFVVDSPYRQTHLITLGNLNNNQTMFYLYGNHWTRVDCKWPGPNGFVVQTIGNPWGTGKNVVILGGSDAAGVEAATSYFMEQAGAAYKQRDLILPLIWKIVTDGKDRPADGLSGGDNHMKFQSMVSSFIGSGTPGALNAIAEFVKGQVNADSSIFDCRHYRAIGVIVALDLIDDTGILNADELLAIDNGYLQHVLGVYKNKAWPYPFAQATSGSDTHSANGALEFYFPASYLLKYGNPNAAARKLLEAGIAEMRPALEGMVRNNHGDYGDIGWTYGLANLCWYRYALHDERFELFDDGYARNQWLLGLALRRHVPTTGIATFYYSDPKMKHSMSGGTINGWGYAIFGGDWPTPDALQPVAPDDLLGVMKVPLDEAHYDHRDMEKGFERICFMDDFKDQRYYMLIQLREHYRNCPSDSTDWIRTLRYDGTDLLSGDTIINDGFRIRARSEISQLLRMKCGKQIASAQTKFSEPMGYADRYRTVLFKRGEYFVVLDRFVVTKAGKATYMRRWHPKGEMSPRGRGWEAGAGEYILRLMPSAPVHTVGGGQMKRVDAKVGDVITFQNLLYAVPPRQSRDYSIVRLTDQAVLVRNDGTDARPVALLGSNNSGKPTQLGKLETDAAVFYISAEAIELFEGTYARVDDRGISLQRSGQAMSAGGDQELASMLAAMYEEAERALKPIVEPEKTLTARDQVLDELWSFDGFKKRGSGVGYRVDKSDEKHWVYDLGREVRLAEIESVSLPTGVTSIEVSREGFDRDSLSVPVETISRPRFGRHHYGWFHHEGVTSIKDVDITCRYVRLPAGQPEGRTKYPGTHVGIEFRSHPLVASVGSTSYDGWSSTSKRTRLTDLDGDGTKELLVATDQHQLFVLSSGGELIWQREFDLPVVDFHPTDLDDDGRKEILMARWDKNLYILDAVGQEILQAHVGLPPKTVGTGPYYVATLPIPGTERKRPAVGTWNVMLTPKIDSDLTKTENWLLAIDDSWPKDSGIRENFDLNGNGRPDILMHGWDGPIVVSEVQVGENGEEQLRYIGNFQSLPGRYFHCDRFTCSEEPEANVILCIGQQGLAAIKLTSAADEKIGFKEVFRLPVNPISCYDVADMNGDGFDDIVFGKPDGYVFMIDNTGKVLANELLGDNVSAIQVLQAGDGRTIIAAVIDGNLTFCDPNLMVLARTDVKGVTALGCLPRQDGDTLVIFGARRWWAARLQPSLIGR